MVMILIILIPAALHSIFEINSTEKHFESFGFEVKFGVGFVTGFGPGESALLQSFHQNPKASSVPIEELYAITFFVEEDEELGGKRVFLELFFDDTGKGIEALAKIAGLSGEADLHAVGEDHEWAED
jgi:hypothetical protein